MRCYFRQNLVTLLVVVLVVAVGFLNITEEMALRDVVNVHSNHHFSNHSEEEHIKELQLTEEERADGRASFFGEGVERVHNSDSAQTTNTTRIQYTLRRGRPDFDGFYIGWQMCDASLSLPDSLRSSLEYISEVQTNLNFLVLGDSVGMQIAGAFQKAAGMTDRKTLLHSGRSFGEGLTVGRTVGGGYAAGWRIHNLLLRRGLEEPTPPKRAAGWRHEYVDMLFNEMDRKQFDSLVIRIPQVWINPEDVDDTKLMETVALAKEIFNASSVTFPTNPPCNNDASRDSIDLLNRMNTAVHAFANQWNVSSIASTGIEHVFSLNFGGLVQNAMKVIAELELGLDPSTDAYMHTHVLNRKWNKNFHPPAALVCGKAPTNATVDEAGGLNCERNGISRDGMHVCMEVLAARMFTALACQQACVHNGRVKDQPVPVCARSCDQRYMGLQSVEGMIDQVQS